MPKPIEYDPFEMDWPWPGMHADADPPTEPSIEDLTPRAESDPPADATTRPPVARDA